MDCQKIQVITNYRQNAIMLKQGKFFLNLPLSEAKEFINEVEKIQDIMSIPLAESLKKSMLNNAKKGL